MSSFIPPSHLLFGLAVFLFPCTYSLVMPTWGVSPAGPFERHAYSLSIGDAFAANQ